MTKLTVQDLPLKGKRALLRVDFNVPFNKDGSIADDTRIREAIPTIQYILDQGGCPIIMSHLGRPKSKNDVQYSLGICAKRLSQLISAPVLFAPDCIGKEVEKMAQELKSGQVLVLENLRFHPAEENPSSDPTFAKQLASLADFYVNDAFGSAHRAHSSTAIICQYFSGKAALGLLMQKELSFFQPLLTNPKRPFLAIIGGAKISTKLGLLSSLSKKVDALFIGGGMAYTFLKTQGLDIGDSIYEETLLTEAAAFIQTCSVPIHFPLDLVIADACRADAAYKTIDVKEGIPKGWQGVDIGPQTVNNWSKLLQPASTIFWNGPVGVFEYPAFARGTEEIAKILSTLSACTIVGGGDSVAAIQKSGLSKNFTHLSTGGGAALEYIEFGKLPGVESASEKLS